MDGERFDTLVQRMNRGGSRRAALALMVGSLGLGPLAAREADAKKNNDKPKTHRCKTVGNKTITCPKKRICCDPKKSTGAGCAPAGAPVCCLSDGFAHRPNIVCCDAEDEGDEGICDTKYPHCCPPSVGGCCVKGSPVCCSNEMFGEYCCPAGKTCCETDPNGCCDDEPGTSGLRNAGVARGEWKARLDNPGRAGIFGAPE